FPKYRFAVLSESTIPSASLSADFPSPSKTSHENNSKASGSPKKNRSSSKELTPDLIRGLRLKSRADTSTSSGKSDLSKGPKGGAVCPRCKLVCPSALLQARDTRKIRSASGWYLS